MNLIAAAEDGMTFQQLWEDPTMRSVVISCGILVVGAILMLIAGLVAKLVRKMAAKWAPPHIALIIARAVRWTLVIAIFCVGVLAICSQFGISLTGFLTAATIKSLVTSTFILLLGIPVSSVLARLVLGVGTRRFSPEVGLMFSRTVRWLLYGVILATVLLQFGVNLGAALGAAGIVGIAVGFAAQTSLSNVISGFFLLGEKPFVVGDLIEVDGVTGTVDKIGMISASVRTPDNRSVRIPNETLVKSKVSNITGNPIRRYDLEVGVAYDEDIEHVMEVLRKVAEDNEHCLDEPNPLVLFLGFGDSSINFLLGCWMVKSDYLLVRNSIAAQVQKAFIREGIEIPFPHRVLASGKANAPIRIQLEKE